jgi:hypothetical protein
MAMSKKDVEVSPNLRMTFESAGPEVNITIYQGKSIFGPISLDRSNALKAANEIVDTGSITLVALSVGPEDREAVAMAIRGFLNEES